MTGVWMSLNPPPFCSGVKTSPKLVCPFFVANAASPVLSWSARRDPGIDAVAAVSTHETALVSSLVPMLQQLEWQGPVDAEFKIDQRDGVAKILEINPRFSGAIHFPIACGVNMALLYCRAALGERLEEAVQPDYPEGMHYLDYGRWLSGLLVELRSPGSARWSVLQRGWRHELRRPRARSVHALSDPGPLLAKLFKTRGDA